MKCDFKHTGKKHPRSGLPELRCSHSRCHNVTYTNHPPHKIHFDCKHPTLFALGDFVSSIAKVLSFGKLHNDEIPKSWLRAYAYYYYAVTFVASLGFNPTWLDPEKGCKCKQRRKALNEKLSLKVPDWLLTTDSPSVLPQPSANPQTTKSVF